MTVVLVVGGTGLHVSEILGLNGGDVKWQDLEVDARRSVVADREYATTTEAPEKPVPLDPAIVTTPLK
jgi:hypothetical protein